MHTTTNSSSALQLTERVQLKAGFLTRKRPRRLKAKHLSELTRREIVRLFMAYESHDDVAREMDTAGLTAKTVSEVLDVYQMRKPPAFELQSRPMLIRRAA